MILNKSTISLGDKIKKSVITRASGSIESKSWAGRFIICIAKGSVLDSFSLNGYESKLWKWWARKWQLKIWKVTIFQYEINMPDNMLKIRRKTRKKKYVFLPIWLVIKSGFIIRLIHHSLQFSKKWNGLSYSNEMMLIMLHTCCITITI